MRCSLGEIGRDHARRRARGLERAARGRARGGRRACGSARAPPRAREPRGGLGGWCSAGSRRFAVVAPRGRRVDRRYIGGKQLAAATDLAFWVVIAERIDARRSQRLVAAARGDGWRRRGARRGARDPARVARRARAACCVGGRRAARARGPRRDAACRRPGGSAAPPAKLRALVARSWRDGARAVRRHPLARHLAVVVAIAGVFGSLAYFALGVRGRRARRLDRATSPRCSAACAAPASWSTLVVQLVVAPRLLARLGTGRALLVAPLVALARGRRARDRADPRGRDRDAGLGARARRRDRDAGREARADAAADGRARPGRRLSRRHGEACGRGARRRDRGGARRRADGVLRGRRGRRAALWLLAARADRARAAGARDRARRGRAMPTVPTARRRRRGDRRARPRARRPAPRARRRGARTAPRRRPRRRGAAARPGRDRSRRHRRCGAR